MRKVARYTKVIFSLFTSRGNWAVVLRLFLPLAALSIMLKVRRVQSFFPESDFFETLELARSETFFYTGVILLFGSTLVFFGKGGWKRSLAVGLVFLSSLWVVIIELVAHTYYNATGVTLDYFSFVFAIVHINELTSLLTSETPTYIIAAIVIILLLILAQLIVRPWRPVPDSAGSSRTKLTIIMMAVSVFPLTFSSFSDSEKFDVTFKRDAVVNIALTGYKLLQERASTVSYANTDLLSEPKLVEREDIDRKNVVFIIMESTRYLATTPYNPRMSTTPFLAELSLDSIFVERAYTIVPHTSKALVSILCGMEPELHMAISETEQDALPKRCLPHLLDPVGYKSVFFQSATKNFENRIELVENFGFKKLYTLEDMDFKDFQKVNYFGLEEGVMLEVSDRWLAKNKNDPILAVYLTLSPHHNYLAPRRYGHKRYVRNKKVNNYLNSVHIVDAFIGNLIKQYKKHGVYDDTIFIIVGDHGEGFGEHKRFQHDNTIYEEGLRVPFIIHYPKRFKGQRRVKDLVNHHDIIPTITDILGYRIEDGNYSGTSILEEPGDRTLLMHCWYESKCLASIRGNLKYIHHFGTRPDQLFDLEKDPFEGKDIAINHLEEVERRRAEALNWRSRVNAGYRNMRLYKNNQK